MTEGDFPFRSFTMREQGYDRSEVDSYADELRAEILELRRALDTATTQSSTGDARLHDPEGAVTRTLAIAQETADRVLHDAQVEADRRRAEADEHATTTIAEADERAARLLGDMEAQAAEVREQGVAAARSAIQVERDKAMAELAHVRRIRDDLRTEAVALKTALDRYRSQAIEASESLAGAASGPLMSIDLPNFVDDDVVLTGMSDEAESDDDGTSDQEYDDDDAGDPEAVAQGYGDDGADDQAGDQGHVENDADDEGSHLYAVENDADDDLADVISIDADSSDSLVGFEGEDSDTAVFDLDLDLDDADDADEDDAGFGSGTFLAEVRAAAEEDPPVELDPEDGESDRFLSELRGIADDSAGDFDSEAADKFFDDN